MTPVTGRTGPRPAPASRRKRRRPPGARPEGPSVLTPAARQGDRKTVLRTRSVCSGARAPGLGSRRGGDCRGAPRSAQTSGGMPRRRGRRPPYPRPVLRAPGLAPSLPSGEGGGDRRGVGGAPRGVSADRRRRATVSGAPSSVHGACTPEPGLRPVLPPEGEAVTAEGRPEGAQWTPGRTRRRRGRRSPYPECRARGSRRTAERRRARRPAGVVSGRRRGVRPRGRPGCGPPGRASSGCWRHGSSPSSPTAPAPGRSPGWSDRPRSAPAPPAPVR